ncbi:lipopolysaccharide transport system permease protein [Aquipseudomonas alcaligenes]|uniref:ABC transporter permease n=1 Tax=Aquipseudomonas alcaligenes TaxID=43263 RepID=UPI0009545675|nr:ABC transporter permease [Pseudomonas alcaligenes]SIS13933.1 lipopolysaccharide transport system permease protein [Pseudomonas alcaligenes]
MSLPRSALSSATAHDTANNRLGKLFQIAWLRALMGLKSEARETRLGYLWWLIEPAMHLTVYYLVFGLLLRHGGDHYVAYLLVGIVHWLWFSKSIQNASSAILVSRGLILQLPLHTAIFPLAEVLRDALKQLLVVAVLVAILAAMGYPPNRLFLLYPLLFALQLLLILPCAGLAAMLMPFFPDMRVIIPAGLQLGMFISGVFFTRDLIPTDYQWLLQLNPVYLILESQRDVLIRQSTPDWASLGLLLAALLLANLATLMLFGRLNRRFARIVQE